MAGILNFTLGLETSKFLSGLGLASSQILSFAALGRGVQAAFENAWGAVERGARLTDLSAMTGESTRNIYKLQESFKTLGISADAVPDMAIKMQRALSGMSESGERTDKIFAALGVNMEGLRGKDLPTQLEILGKAMSKLSKEDAAAAANTLFGRTGAGNLMTIARDARSFSDALKETAADAEIFGRNAARWDTLSDTLGRMRGHIDGMWAGVAEGLTPALERAVNVLKNADWADIGAKIAAFFSPQEKPVETSFGTKLLYGLPGIHFGLQGVAGLIGGEMGVPFAKEWADERIGLAGDLFKKAGLDGGIIGRISKAMDAKAKPVSVGDDGDLEKMDNGMGGELFPGSGGGGSSKKSSRVARVSSDANAWEKIGLVMGGGASRDHTQTTASNTSKMVGLLTKTNELLGRGGSALGFENV